MSQTIMKTKETGLIAHNEMLEISSTDYLPHVVDNHEKKIVEQSSEADDVSSLLTDSGQFTDPNINTLIAKYGLLPHPEGDNICACDTKTEKQRPQLSQCTLIQLQTPYLFIHVHPTTLFIYFLRRVFQRDLSSND